MGRTDRRAVVLASEPAPSEAQESYLGPPVRSGWIVEYFVVERPRAIVRRDGVSARAIRPSGRLALSTRAKRRLARAVTGRMAAPPRQMLVLTLLDGELLRSARQAGALVAGDPALRLSVWLLARLNRHAAALAGMPEFARLADEMQHSDGRCVGQPVTSRSGTLVRVNGSGRFSWDS